MSSTMPRQQVSQNRTIFAITDMQIAGMIIKLLFYVLVSVFLQLFTSLAIYFTLLILDSACTGCKACNILSMIIQLVSKLLTYGPRERKLTTSISEADRTSPTARRRQRRDSVKHISSRDRELNEARIPRRSIRSNKLQRD